MTIKTTTTNTARAKHAGRKRLPSGDYRRFNLYADSFLLFVMEELARENGVSVSRCINDVLAYAVDHLEELPLSSTFGDFPAFGEVFL